jgi:hypothetical protein
MMHYPVLLQKKGPRRQDVVMPEDKKKRATAFNDCP